MVQFRNIVIADSRVQRKPKSGPRKVFSEGLYPPTENRRALDSLVNPAGNTDVKAYHKLLFVRVENIQRRDKKDRQRYSHLIVSIIKHILEHNLVDEIQRYAASIPDTLSSTSHIISLVLAHLRAGIRMGCSTDQLLKTSLEVIIQDPGGDDTSDAILYRENIMKPERTSLVEKPAGLVRGTLAHLISGQANARAKGNKGTGIRDEETLPEDDRTGFEKGETETMEHSDDIHTEMKEITPRPKRSLSKLWLGLVAVLVIGGGALWFTGNLPFDKGKKAGPVLTDRTKTGVIKKIIKVPADTAKPEPPPSTKSLPQAETPSAMQKKGIPPAEPTSRTETIPPEPAESPQPTETAPAKIPPAQVEKYPYSLHVGSFQTIRRAREALAELTKEGLSPYWVRVDLGEKGRWFRILVGNFLTAESADQFLKAHGLEVARVLKTAYAVRLGVFSSKTAQDEKIRTLENAGYCPYYVSYAENRHELLIGAYQNEKDAEKTAAELKASGIDGEVILR